MRYGLVAGAMAVMLLASWTPARAEEGRHASYGVGGAYYEDSDDNRRHDESLWAALPVGTRHRIAVEAVSRAAHDSDGDPSSQQVLAGFDTKLRWSLDTEARAGVIRFDGDVDPAGRLVVRKKGRWGEADGRFEYAALSETAEMIRNHITFAGLELGGKAALHERLRPGLRTRLRDYSDNNQSVRVRADVPVALVLEPVRWEVGYREEYASFERQTGSGYFDPSELNSFQGVTSLTYWSERIEAYGEFYAGSQDSRRYGDENSDGFYGVYLEAAVSHVGPFRIAATAEGGDYTLTSAGGFRHVQAGLRISNNP